MLIRRPVFNAFVDPTEATKLWSRPGWLRQMRQTGTCRYLFVNDLIPTHSLEGV